MLKTDETVIFNSIYLPLSDSKFNASDELDMFEVEISNMCTENKNVYLIGGFNARTKPQDFIDVNNLFF